MPREIDIRDFSVNLNTPERRQRLRDEAARVSGLLPGEQEVTVGELSPLTGNPSLVVTNAAPSEPGNFIQRALSHVQNIGGVLGLSPSQPAEFVADPQEQQTSSGAVAVHMQQHYKGIPIFQANGTVRFAPDGELKETAGSIITVADDVPASASLSVQDAVLKAAEHVATPDPDEEQEFDQFGQPLPRTPVDLSGFTPKVIAAFPNKPEQPTVLEAGPFGAELKASLIWFPQGDKLRLSWEVIITLPNLEGQYRVLVDANTGEVVFARQLIQGILARGNVFRLDGSQPRQMVDFPRPLSEYAETAGSTTPPQGFPDDWVGSAASGTAGNSVAAHVGISGPPLAGTLAGDVVVFDPTNQQGDDQRVLNIFYYNCWIHDFFYLLGFREQSGNFQLNNFGRGGIPGDRVDARSHPGAVAMTANFVTPVDGTSPVMNMGLVTTTNRHTALDASVVFHEFTHGVTNRLVGGPSNIRALDAPQSQGMGEGLSDYFACTITKSPVVAAWVVNNPRGIRQFPYDQFPSNTDNFGSLGRGRYRSDNPHAIGEIWCATLLEMNRRIGSLRATQLVVDALKLAPANPSFLDMRDAILSAEDNQFAAGRVGAAGHAEARNGIWQSFAKFGMGPNAVSNGPSLSGVVADFNPPPDLAVPAEQPAAPSISDVNASAVTSTTADISWVTDKPSDSQVEFGPTSAYGSSTQLNPQQVTNHAVRLSGLAPGTTIHYRVRSGGAGGQAVSSDFNFSTAAAPAPATQQPVVVRVSGADASVPTALVSTAAVQQAGTAGRLRVTVEFVQTTAGDLQVELVSPTGQRVLLHNRSGGGQTTLAATFDSETNQALRAFTGRPIKGNWLLAARNVAERNVGRLNAWSLELTPPPPAGGGTQPSQGNVHRIPPAEGPPPAPTPTPVTQPSPGNAHRIGFTPPGSSGLGHIGGTYFDFIYGF